MSQLYLQRFEYRAAAKSEFDQAWTIALQTLPKRLHSRASLRSSARSASNVSRRA
jgi:hypothetical protein